MLLPAATAKKPYKRQVAYLEGTGTQWLDTGVLAPLGAEIEVEFSPTASATMTVFGGRDAGGYSATDHTCTLFTISGTPMSLRFDRAGQIGVGSVSTSTRFNFRYAGSSATLLNVNTQEQTTTSLVAPTTFTAYPLSLFAVNTAGTRSTFFHGKIFFWRHLENGSPVRDFIPVLDWNDRPAMYDKVSKQLFYNQGTGEFDYA